MSKVNIDINTEDLEKILDQLSGKEMMTAQRRALSRAGRLLYKAAKQNAASSVPKVRQPNPKYTDTMYEGVRMSVTQGDDFKWYFKVHILGTRKKTSGTFRLRFFGCILSSIPVVMRYSIFGFIFVLVLSLFLMMLYFSYIRNLQHT